MSLIKWTEEFSVGIKSIDQQHQKLVGLLNQLFEAMKSGKGNDVLGQILKELVEYTKIHFNTEEELMKRYNYPDFLSHKKEHDELTQKTMNFQNDFIKGKCAITVQLSDFLKNWLTNHILKTDKKYASVFSKLGGLN